MARILEYVKNEDKLWEREEMKDMNINVEEVWKRNQRVRTIRNAGFCARKRT